MRIHPLRKLRKLVQRSMFYRWYAARVLSSDGFRFAGQEYAYTIHPHNFTWTNERAVELSLARAWLDEYPDQRILEVGNVTRHYLGTSHPVVDKYEKAPGVMNTDIIDFQSDADYDLVFAISTLEHVGWDRDRREEDKIPVAVAKLKQLLRPGGELRLTVPLGYNAFLDRFLEMGTLEFDETKFLRRINQANQWEESDWDRVRSVNYNSPFNNANAIAIAKYKRPE